MNVRCDNCGMTIPYYGRVCPQCGANKSVAKRDMNIELLIGLLIAAVALLYSMAVLKVDIVSIVTYTTGGFIIGAGGGKAVAMITKY